MIIRRRNKVSKCTKRVGKGELFWQITNHVTFKTLRIWIAQVSLDRKSWQGGKGGRFAEVGSELAIWKAMRSFPVMFVLAFGKRVPACMLTNIAKGTTDPRVEFCLQK